MERPFRQNVRISKGPQFESLKKPGLDAAARQRDTRPGHFTIKGQFIQLPDARETGGDSQSARASD